MPFVFPLRQILRFKFSPPKIKYVPPPLKQSGLKKIIAKQVRKSYFESLALATQFAFIKGSSRLHRQNHIILVRALLILMKFQ